MRIAIVNDTIIATEALRRVLKTVPEYEIAWIARNGAEAVTKCAKDTPNLILMDLFMPVMDGAEAIRRIMADSPCAILIVTATVSGHVSKVFEAMGYGALDVVRTPILGTGGATEGGASLLAKISTISKLIGKSAASPFSPRSHSSINQSVSLLVAIGASTGGPQALAKILSSLDTNFTAGIIVVQHIDVRFAPGLAEWLNQQTHLPVEPAAEGCRVEPGKVLLAATNDHLILQPDFTLSYTQVPRNYPYRPSVDVFFESLATYWTKKGVAVLLTGMGRDGATGMKSLRSLGWHTIAQDQSTSVVYGMPKAAVELGVVAEILPVEEIAPALMRFSKI